MESLKISQAKPEDINRLRAIADAQGAAKDPDYFELSFEYQDAGERVVLIATCDGEDAGYAMLSLSPKYAFYKAHGIPEIQDLNVLKAFRNRGIASAMIGHCENLAREKGYEEMGISVGLTASYGAAQRLYVRLGYVPDGHGVTYDRKPVAHAEFRPVDDDLCLMMVKRLQK